jgi:hypothetical protein
MDKSKCFIEKGEPACPRVRRMEERDRRIKEVTEVT